MFLFSTSTTLKVAHYNFINSPPPPPYTIYTTCYTCHEQRKRITELPSFRNVREAGARKPRSNRAMRPVLATLVLATCVLIVTAEKGGFRRSELNCSASLHIPLEPTTQHLDDGSMLQLYEGEYNSNRCPPWYVYDPLNKTCQFTYSVSGRVSYVVSTLQTVVLQCYCMTNDSATHQLAVSACPYTCLVDAGCYSLPCEARSVESYTCERFSRSGLSCGDCAPGHAPPIYSYTSHCVPCSHTDSPANWIRYLTVAFVPLTLFTVCVIVFQIRATSPYLFSYIFFVQTMTLTVNLRLLQMLLENGKISSEAVTKLGITLLSFWNLDFFRMYYSPFCLHPSMTTLTANFVDVFIALYPFLIIACLALLTKLGLGRTRACMVLCKPFHLLCRHFGTEWDMRSSLISSLATFVLLSNGKVVSVAFDVLMPAYVYPINQHTHAKLNVFSSGSIKYFGNEHAPLAILSILFLFLLVIIPMVLLMFYPFAFFRRALRKLNLDSETLRSFVNLFHESYKTKGEDGAECRWFPVFYFLLRIILLLVYGATLSSFFFPIEGVVMTAFMVFLSVFRPRKSEAHNAIDIFHVMCFLIFILGIMADITANSQTKRRIFLHTSILTIVFSTTLLFLYIISLVVHFLFYRMGLNNRIKQLMLHTPARRWLSSQKSYERLSTGENFDPLNGDYYESNDDEGSGTQVLIRKPNSYGSTYSLTLN